MGYGDFYGWLHLCAVLVVHLPSNELSQIAHKLAHKFLLKLLLVSSSRRGMLLISASVIFFMLKASNSNLRYARRLLCLSSQFRVAGDLITSEYLINTLSRIDETGRHTRHPQSKVYFRSDQTYSAAYLGCLLVISGNNGAYRTAALNSRPCDAHFH